MSFPVFGLFPLGSRRLAPLPYDAEVEYVESTGTQYVDTGVFATLNTVFALSFLPTSVAVSSWVFGARSTTSDRFCLFFNRSALSVQVGSVLAAPPFAVTASRHSLTLDRGNLVFDATTIAIGASNAFAGAYPMYICSLNNSGANYGSCSMRIFVCSIYHGATLVRDFVPVRVGSVGYLYDRANPTGGPLGNGLYGSATSTPLVAGPDKNGG